MRGFDYSDLTGRNFGTLEKWSLRRSGHLREVRWSHGGSTVVQILNYGLMDFTYMKEECCELIRTETSVASFAPVQPTTLTCSN